MNNRLFKIRILPRWIIIAIDTLFLFFSAILAYLLRFNFDYSYLNNFNVNHGIVCIVISGFIAGIITRSYAGIVRYTGIQDAGRILITLLIATLLVEGYNYYFYQVNESILIPQSVIVIAFFTSIMLLFFYRIGVKSLFAFFWRNETEKTKIGILGTNRTGLITRHVIENDHSSKYRVIAYFDFNRQRIGKRLDGIKIFPADKYLLKVIASTNIQELILADQSISIEDKNLVVDTCLKAGVRVRSVPPIERWIKGELSLNQIKEVNIEDLLGRESIKLDSFNINQELKGKRVLVTGAAGSIGSELVRQALYYHPTCIVMVDQAETPLHDLEIEIGDKRGTIPTHSVVADVTNEERMDELFREYEPEVVFHAAAYKHVPMMEKNPSEAIICNIFGTKVVADLAVKYGVEKFVMISTDKAVNPTSVMGASKRIAEIYVQSLNHYLREKNEEGTKFITTRFGNVLGSNGSVIPLFRKQIGCGGPVTVTHPEITRFFMTIPEACQLVLEAGAMGNGGEIFVFDMGQSIKIADLARKMIMLSGYEVGKNIEIVYSGLREGEKLYEEVMSTEENTLPTYHHKILISKTREMDYEESKNLIENLVNSAFDKDEMKLVGMMKYIVPEYLSNQSRFESLDLKKSKSS